MDHKQWVEFYSVETGQKSFGTGKIPLKRVLKHVNEMITHNTNNDWFKSQGSCWYSGKKQKQ